jgi:tight adherence protein C
MSEAGLFVIVIVVFAGTLFLSTTVLQVVRFRWEHSNLLNKVKYNGTAKPVEAADEVLPVEGEGARRHFMRVIGRLGSFAKPKKEAEQGHLNQRFLRAGYRMRGAVIAFFGFKVFFAILFPCLLYVAILSLQKPFTSLHVSLSLIVAAIMGFYLPDGWLKFVTLRRQEMLEKGFPDALDLLVVCVEAGMGLDQAISRVSEEMRLTNRVISDEFKVLNLELRAGMARRDALRNLAFRCGIADVNSLVTLMIQTDKYGTRVAQTLRVYSDSMRMKRYQKAEELAHKLPVKLVFPLILFIFPSLFVAIIGSALVQLYRMMGH